jgi:hypothetical protein
MIQALQDFEAKWLARLNNGAKTEFHYASAPAEAALYTSVADSFVASRNYSKIGFNWELLDATAQTFEPRSALGELKNACANRISNPSQAWLGEAAGEQCAQDFLACFDPGSLTLVSNRYDGLWNPISGASVEWGFVGFDAESIALLLISEG